MAKKVFFKGEKFVFSRVKGNAETDYREGDINITPSNLGQKQELTYLHNILKGVLLLYAYSFSYIFSFLGANVIKM